MSSPVDVEELRTTRGFLERFWLSSDASPKKEVGESDKFYSPISPFHDNVSPNRIDDLLIRWCWRSQEVSRPWFGPWFSSTDYGDFKQSKAEEEAHASLSWSSSFLGTCGQKRELATEWSEEEIKYYGYTPMHVAASNGDLETLTTLIETNKNERLRRDKHGGTPLHAAATGGMVEAMKVILEACPDAVKGVTLTRNNCLHTAILYNQVGAVGFLVEWLGRNRDYAHLINGKDYDGKTPLHLAVSAKQIKILEVLLTCKMVDVNAMSSGGFTALDILDVLPRDRIIDVEIGWILNQAGALRARGLANRDTNQHAALRYKRKNFIARHVVVLLVMATLVLIAGYQAVFPTLNSTLKEDYFCNPTLDGTLQRNKQESFLMFNSIWFVGSLAVVIFLLRKFPFKPWSQISVSMLFGSYMCCIFSMSPGVAWNLLLLAISLLLLAAAGKLFGLGRKTAQI